jgi:hypothetical protein
MLITAPWDRVQCLEYLGNHFRIILELPSRMTDLQVWTDFQLRIDLQVLTDF